VSTAAYFATAVSYTRNIAEIAKKGAKTLRIITLSITTHSITTLSLKALSIIGLFMTLSVTVSSAVMLSVIVLIFVMASVVAPNEGGGLNQHKLTKQDCLFK
jgi:hypothetical protein